MSKPSGNDQEPREGAPESSLESTAEEAASSERATDSASEGTATDGPAEEGGESGGDGASGEPSSEQGGDGADAPAERPDGEPAKTGEESESDEGEEGEEAEPARMSLLEHLGELRTRLVRCVIAAFVGLIACWGFKERILDVLMEPMLKVLEASGQTHFIYLQPAEAFFTYVKASFLGGLVLMSPYLFYQLWAFIAPGLYPHERKWLIPIALFSALLFVAGACFGYFVVFPVGFDYFASFISPQLQFLPALATYFGFAVKMLLAFGLIFEMPLFILFLARLGMVTAAGMRRMRRYNILIIFIVAAILTPPDPFSQTLMALPLLVLYEISIYVASIFGRKTPEKEEKEDEEAKEERAGEEA